MIEGMSGRGDGAKNEEGRGVDSIEIVMDSIRF
jgi:hypothetical protein